MQDEPYRELPILDRHGAIRALVKVSPEDYDEMALRNWHLAANRYAARSQRFGPGVKRMIYMHRALLGLDHEDERVADHINGDTLDNRRGNLRAIARHDNMQNIASHVGSSSRYRGVAWDVRLRRWKASACLNRKQIHIGLYETEDAAAIAVRRFHAEHMPYSVPERNGHPEEPRT